MRRVVRCPACSSCAKVVGCGFVARARLWCTELDRWVDADGGRVFGERGEPRAGVVPRPRQRGRGAPALADVDLRPCAARDRHPPGGFVVPVGACARARPGTGT